MKRVVNITPDFTELLVRLKPDTSNVCLFTGGGGWQEKIAWNPCASFVLDANSELGGGLDKFVAENQRRNRLIAGFINYNLGYKLKGINKTKKDRFNLPDAVFFAYENYLGKTNGKVYAHYTNDAFLTELERLNKPTAMGRQVPKPGFIPLWDRKPYAEAFKKIKKYIFEGDIYQINLTQELEAEYDASPRSLFADLSGNNIAGMKAYFEGTGFELISMSPERFVRTKGKIIETTPVKGTRPRGKTPEEDKKNELSLLSDEKEEAELNMITDLLRNDLGKVCSPGSVEVVEKQQVEKLTSVMHTFSRVRGKLKTQITPLEALVSMFPGGSITGCPKKKAMEIIDELEQSARGAYCGSVIVIDKNGDLDSSILIRTIAKQGRRLSLSVGSGIVYDSLEQKEYQENLDKAESLST